VFRPGDWVRGHVAVLEGGGSRDLSVAVRYLERSPDYSATVVELSGGTLNRGDLTRGASYEFAIQLSPDALPSLNSPHGELYWEVEAKSDEFGPDTTAQLRFDVTLDAPG
jgi:hypothetical protein